MPSLPTASADPIANLEAEQSVLGAILLRPQILPEILPILTSAAFYRQSHARIYQVMCDLQESGRPVDLVTVTWMLRERGQLEEVGGPLFLSGLSEHVGIAVNAGYYAQQVRDKQQVRLLAARAQEILGACTSFNGDGKIADLLLYAESQIQDSVQQIDLDGPAVLTAKELLAKDFTQKTPVLGGGLLPEGCGLIIAGESGEGKSMLRLELALHLALGRDLWGLEIPRPRRVLIIQFENMEQLEQVRLKRMLRGLKVDCPEHLWFSSPLVRFDLTQRGDQARLMSAIQKYQAEVVIYDPLSSLHQANENDNAQMRWVMDNLTEVSRRTGSTAIVVHHYGKPGKEEVSGLYRTRGATSIRDWCDTLIGYSKRQGDDLILRNLEFLKVRNGPEPRAMILARDKETFLHRVSEGDTVCSPAKILALLADLGGAAEQEKLLRAIQQAVGCQERRAREFLQEAVDFRYVRKEDHPTDRRKKIVKPVFT